uniref:EamA domain-containing protein n=1 Tax=Aureoumbra lagunensis TaxID=44058 RepID=A0A7S3K2A9_9STRA|mmetsp:Transcript_12476/g.16794  ORF Transcript_12476/g.16794 Transcript_12476/m.16794 type:complete len:395 (-) Transcript_12476:182-1366(-)
MEMDTENLEKKGLLFFGLLLPTRDSIGLGITAIVLWTTVGLVPMFIKCFQTSTSCTRWGPSGSDFSHPLTATAYQLSIVGIFLLPFGISILSIQSIKACAPVGIAFGLKYAVSHVALQKTPSSVYALLHASTIVFIVIFSRLFLGEKMRSRTEIAAFFGVLAGTAISASQEFESVGIIPLILTLCDCCMGGALVPLLRKALLILGTDPKRALPVTCLKALIGAIIVFPIALSIEGIQIPNHKQTALLFLSASIILIYHGNLSFMCSLATGIAVGILESVKGIPAFTITSLMQGIPHTSLLFWAGAILVLISAAAFKIARAAQQHLYTKSNYIEEGGTGLINPLVVDNFCPNNDTNSLGIDKNSSSLSPGKNTLLSISNESDEAWNCASRERASV